MDIKDLDVCTRQILREKVQQPITSLSFSSVGGGSINDTYKITVSSGQRFFIKINSAERFPLLFEKEKNGLNFIADKRIIRTPAVIDCSIFDNNQILVLEWIEQELKSPSFWKNFGKQLASLHKISNDYFGFTEHNYMGALPQDNTHTTNWVDFFIHHRLQPQVHLAENKGLLNTKQIHQFQQLYDKLNDIFNKEDPSLLHGDLWSGNFMCDERFQPVLIDPAVYFGHRSMDLAMTTLFGGFDKSFYETYHYYFPFPENYREQWDVCNLYPLLVHLNLFGSGYLHDITTTLKKFTA